MADPVRPGTAARDWSKTVRALLAASAVLAAVLLVAAEFTTLFSIHVASSRVAIRTVSTGVHHSYALVPVGLLALFLAAGVGREGSRPALLAIGLLGVITLLLALIGDLPDAHASGLIGTRATHFEAAAATPGAGLYIETGGAALLIMTCTSGFILAGPPALRRPTRRAQTNGAHG